MNDEFDLSTFVDQARTSQSVELGLVSARTAGRFARRAAYYGANPFNAEAEDKFHAAYEAAFREADREWWIAHKAKHGDEMTPAAHSADFERDQEG